MLEDLSIICKILSFVDLQMKPYRTDEFIHKLFYETSRFGAFNNQWVVKARINSNQRDPTQSSERDITYQVRKTVMYNFIENFKYRYSYTCACT